MERMKNGVHAQCTYHMCFMLYEYIPATFLNQLNASYRTALAMSFKHEVT